MEEERTQVFESPIRIVGAQKRRREMGRRTFLDLEQRLVERLLVLLLELLQQQDKDRPRGSQMR